MSTDKHYLDTITANILDFRTYLGTKLKRNVADSYPLDDDILSTLQSLIVTSKDNELFEKVSDVQNLWNSLVKKSIVCLRYYDTREPFQKNRAKKPLAYGTDSLLDYFKKYTDFESLDKREGIT